MATRDPAGRRAAPALDIDTPEGPARVHLRAAEAPVAALVLGHGAGGTVTAPDLRTATAVALEARVSVALVEQPYRVAGRRTPPPAPRLDAAWIAVVGELRAGPLAGLRVVCGGRSSGARVACRTAAATGAVAVLCLAFPLRPPQRRAGPPAPTRQDELDAVAVPVLVVQGARDAFGMPAGGEGREVVVVPGDHRLNADREAVADAVRAWIPRVLA